MFKKTWFILYEVYDEKAELCKKGFSFVKGYWFNSKKVIDGVKEFARVRDDQSLHIVEVRRI